MDIYVAELDEEHRVAAVWIKRKKARSPSIFDPNKHMFDPQVSDEFLGAPREDIVRWLRAEKLEARALS